MSEPGTIWVVVEEEAETAIETGVRGSRDTEGTFGESVVEKVSQVMKICPLL